MLSRWRLGRAGERWDESRCGIATRKGEQPMVNANVTASSRGLAPWELGADVLEQLPDAVLVANESGRIVFATGATQAVLARPAGDLVGLSIEDLMPMERRERHKKLRAEFHARPRRRLMSEDLNLNALRGDGHTIPVSVMLSPIERDGESFVIAVVRDISLDVVREKVKEDTLTRYWELFNSSPDAIYISTRTGRILEANAAMQALVGYSPAELAKIDVRRLYAEPGDRDLFQGQIAATGVVKDMLIRLRRKDGQVRKCLLSATVHRTRAGEIAGYQGILKDITEEG